MIIWKMKEGPLALGGKNIVVAVALMSLSACVQIKAPDKPIEINLNIRINQEIVYKLDGDAKKLIDQNSGIF